MSVIPFAVLGDFSIFAARSLRERLLAALDQGDEVEVDLSRVTDADSAGMQLMVAAKAEAAARGKTLRFVGHAPAVLDVIELCDLGDLMAQLGDAEAVHPRT